jgi:hypothetical protein
VLWELVYTVFSILFTGFIYCPEGNDSVNLLLTWLIYVVTFYVETELDFMNVVHR